MREAGTPALYLGRDHGELRGDEGERHELDPAAERDVVVVEPLEEIHAQLRADV